MKHFLPDHIQLLFASALLLLALPVSAEMQPELQLQHIQMIGSHNSYKRALDPEIKTLLQARDAKMAARIDYSHPSIEQQLAMGIRHFEIDIVVDTQGGKFSSPWAETHFNKTILSEQERQDLLTPGFKVLHIPDIDFSSHCVLLTQCLNIFSQFSENHEDHLPIIVLMNLKENGPKDIDGAIVTQFAQKDYAELDRLLLSTFGESLLRPDDVRGTANTLKEAILAGGWPSLKNLRGHFLFVLDGKSHQLTAYKENHPSLRGRSLFGNYEPGKDESAIVLRNDPSRYAQQIATLVKQGYLVRTRADGGYGSMTELATVKQRTRNAIASGAHIISTDFYPGAGQILASDFAVSFRQGAFVSCNQMFKEIPCELSQ